jgi:hypothetical protein
MIDKYYAHEDELPPAAGPKKDEREEEDET